MVCLFLKNKGKKSNRIYGHIQIKIVNVFRNADTGTSGESVESVSCILCPLQLKLLLSVLANLLCLLPKLYSLRHHAGCELRTSQQQIATWLTIRVSWCGAAGADRGALY